MPQFVHHGDSKGPFARSMFARIAHRYDLLNRLISLGMDQRWRRLLANTMALRPGDRILDLACGTGDQAVALLRSQPECTVVGADPVPEMLAIAKNKLPDANLVCCEAEALPFPTGSFDGVTISFGIRNFSFLETGLNEMVRVTIKGGRIGILEFASPGTSFVGRLVNWYANTFIPLIGKILGGGSAYRYLPESIEQFPEPDTVVDILERAGLGNVHTRSLMAGLVILYYGEKR